MIASMNSWVKVNTQTGRAIVLKAPETVFLAESAIAA
jgi:hypothetical protein